AIIGLKKADAKEARDKAKKIIKERAPKFVGFSAGCVFKNIEVSAEEAKLFKEKYPDFPDQYVEYCKIPVAWLIDRCGLKGKVIGGAKVSQMHAGIIINTGNATAENVIMLISLIKQQVRDTFGLQLSEEIEYIGF
ncbi:MAG: UDP-N-acetylenolpyruvoylglucosamine reductase, partial [Candidatus Paceibacterota bacterium]